MVEVAEIHHLEIDPFGAHIRPCPQRGGDLVGRSRGAVLAEFLGLAPDGRGAPDHLGLVSATAQISAAENVIVAGSRSMDSHAARTRSHCVVKNSSGRERHVELGGETSRQCGRPLRSTAADDDRDR